VESNGYIDVGDIPGNQQLKKNSSTENLTEEEKEGEDNDLYWNDLYWKASGASPVVQDTSTEASSQDSSTEGSDIYWNDGLLPPVSPNTAMSLTGGRKEEKNFGKSNERSATQNIANFRNAHAQSLKKLWHATNISSSEDEDAQVNRVKTKKPSKQVCAGRMNAAMHAKSTSVDADSFKPVLLPKPRLLDQSKLTNRDRCLSTPQLLSTNEKEMSSACYNTAAVEVARHISESNDGLFHPSKSSSSPKVGSFLSAEASKQQRSNSCNATYANLEILIGDESSEHGSENEWTGYQNSSTLQTKLSPLSGSPERQDVEGDPEACTASLDPHSSENTKREDGFNEYYNSSAALLMSDQKSKLEEDRSYYNAAAILRSLSSKHGHEEKGEVTHEHLMAAQNAFASPDDERKKQFEGTTASYYNSSAVEMMGEDILKRNPGYQGSPSSERKMGTLKSEVQHHKYYNLNFYPPDGEVSHNTASSSVQKMTSRESSNNARSCGVGNENCDPSLTVSPNHAEDVDTELEESSREDVLELLKARARQHKNKPYPGHMDLPNSLHHTYSNLAENSRMLDSAKAKTIVHITPAYDIAPAKQKKLLPSVMPKPSLEENQGSKNTTSSVQENLQTKTHTMRELDDPQNKKTEKTPKESCKVTCDQGVKRVVQKAEKPLKKPQLKKKPAQLTKHNHHPNSPSSGTGQTSRASPGTSRSNTPSPSPTAILSPLFSPNKRNRNFFDSSTQTHRSSKPLSSDLEKGNKINSPTRRSGKAFPGSPSAPSASNSTTAGNGMVKESRVKTMKDEHKALDKCISNPILLNKFVSEPQGTGQQQSQIKSLLVKVWSNPHISTGSSQKARPSPPPKSSALNAHVSAKSRPRPLSKKPVVHASTSSPSHTETTQVVSQSQSSSSIISSPPSHRTSQKSSSEGSSEIWQRRSKKPLIPPIFQQGQDRKGSYKDSIAPHLSKDVVA